MVGTSCQLVHPPGWPRPSGYVNGLRVPAGYDLLFVAGQVGWDASQQIVPGGFVAQFEQALSNCAEVVRTAGGGPEHIVRMTVYVVDRRDYLSDLAAVGAAWRRVMGRHYPVMALVQVAALIESQAEVEIEATAAMPPGAEAAEGSPA